MARECMDWVSCVQPIPRRSSLRRPMPDPRRPSPDSRPSADFALVTVTHNSAPQLAALLASVARHLPGVRVIVVDCASSDDTVQVARGWPGALTVALGDNVGF